MWVLRRIFGSFDVRPAVREHESRFESSSELILEATRTQVYVVNVDGSLYRVLEGHQTCMLSFANTILGIGFKQCSLA